MKNIFFIFILLIICNLTLSKPISEYSAKIAGKNFLLTKANSASFKNGIALQLVYTASVASAISAPNTTTETCFYVFNTNAGFVIVSGDDASKPVLAYSNEGPFDPNNLPTSVAYWLNGYQDQIQYIIENNVHATAAIAAQWNALINNKLQPS